MVKKIQNILKWFTTPQSSGINPKNFVRVQIDAFGVALATSASPFLQVFLARLEANALQVSLLTTMPAITGFLLAIPSGRLLQRQKNIIPWFSFSRLAVVSSFALTGILALIVPQKYLINSILVLWAIVTIPQTLLNICFSVVMNNVAGPTGRFELMSHRWSIMGVTTAVSVLMIGQFLVRVPLPTNYILVFIAVSLGGLISFYFSSHLELSEMTVIENKEKHSLIQNVKEYWNLIRSQPEFLSFVSKRLIFATGTAMVTPLFTLYYVKVVDAPDSWIAAFTTVKTAIIVIGYFLWVNQSKKRGSKAVLLWSTAGIALYPILVAITKNVIIISIFAGFAGIFQAGLNLVFFDELLKKIPAKYSATFVSFDQGIGYLSAILSPMVGSYLAETIGIGYSNSLMLGGAISFIGFFLFLFGYKTKAEPAITEVA